jgi:hypothetical protein
MKLLTLMGALTLCSSGVLAQTLQTVTTNGNITNNSIIITRNNKFQDEPNLPALHLFYDTVEGVVAAGTLKSGGLVPIPLLFASTYTINEGRFVIGKDVADDGGTSLQVKGGFKFFQNSGNNYLTYNGSADVRLRYADRGTGGRAIVHDNGNVLTLNYAGDFDGGTQISNNVFLPPKMPIAISWVVTSVSEPPILRKNYL